MRFDENGQKITREINYPPEIIVPEYNHEENNGESIKSRVIYTLSSIIVHQGNQISSGHYVCYVHRSGRWFYCSDIVVKETSTLVAYLQNAYMLFYERKVQEPKNAIPGQASSNAETTNHASFSMAKETPVSNITTYAKAVTGGTSSSSSNRSVRSLSL